MKIHNIEKQIIAQNNRKGLGYESTLDYNFGYLSALYTNRVINRKEYNTLKKVYASTDNGDGRYFVTKAGGLGTDII